MDFQSIEWFIKLFTPIMEVSGVGKTTLTKELIFQNSSFIYI